MNLHEYQAKQLLKSKHIPVPPGETIFKEDDIPGVLHKLGGSAWVVKAQIHAGGRGKAGGVKLVKSKEELLRTVKHLLGTHLVTHQTTAEGQIVNQVLIESLSDIARELYLSFVIDRGLERVICIASTEGGVDIEEVADHSPEKILKIAIDPSIGIQDYQARKLFFSLKLPLSTLTSFTKIIHSLYHLFIESDLSLLEINPFVLTRSDTLICLDAKISVDENALYRQAHLRNMRDTSQEDPKETVAHQFGLSYIKLDGNIGCLVNGAGLAMATMDLIKLHGADPANFLDVGGSATQERVTEAFKIIVSDPNVKGILVNIFGGIVRCDLIADGIIAAAKEVGINIPIVVRLEGNQSKAGSEKLAASGMNIIPATDFDDAAAQIVSCINKNN